MKRFVFHTQAILVAMITATAVFVYDREQVLSMDLRQFQWKNRLLFLFAPDPNHPNVEQFKRDIARQPDEIKDRDLVIFEINERGPSRINTAPLDRQTADSIRGRFDVPANKFTLVLVGKDGWIKLKGGESVRLADVFGLIDSMPMRQHEMRQQNQ